MVKKLKNSVSILLVFTLLNVVVGKTVHELFFHHHEVECTAESDQHFHENEFSDVDLICSFNFSASINQFFNVSVKHQLFDDNRKIEFLYKSYNKNKYFTTLSLRGPPLV